MDIASLSMALSQAKAMQQVSLSMQKKSMDVVETQMQGVVEMMQAATPASGHRMDIRA